MSEIAKTYSPGNVETKWYERWLEKKAFKAEPSSSEDAYAIMMPPPNVTGVLTMGHVLNGTIQDILIRRARQEGKQALWLPGTDHAGIATQTKVEKALKDAGSSRKEIGREAFLQKAYEWRDEHGGKINQQFKRLGASCDWDRLVHTLDEDYSSAVLHTFVELYKRGHVYRGKRMVNWCPASLTALSDEEVIPKTVNSTLYHVAYELVEHPGERLVIATTRPETIPADSALAVNPNDERYKQFIGKHVYRPLNKEAIPVIADEAVELEFGTGVLKVTPAHDALDFAIGQRHNLPAKDLLTPNGILNEFAGPELEGLERFEGRKLAAHLLEDSGALVKTEAYESNVGYSERADVPIEPRISEQWFLRYPKVEEAKQVVKDGTIRFWPQRWEKTYLHWLENIQDWCISRQLWWGHRIPVWYKKGQDRKDPANWHVSLEAPADIENWEQDEDVLDTWASSWLWTFATFGWPDAAKMKAQGFDKFHPTDVLVTGPDIIFFWVSRMIMAALELLPEGENEPLEAHIPFKNVYFTGIIRDAQGRKMSKSLGNSPDPIDLIDKYGADGLRFGIMSMAPQGQDILFNEELITQGRNFCNKLWNAARLRQMAEHEADNSSLEAIVGRIDGGKMDAHDHSILLQLLDTIEAVEKYLGVYEFNQAANALYGFFWNNYCSWYLEVSKQKLKTDNRETTLAVQDLVLRTLLQLLHPYTPFITEELWQDMGYGSGEGFIQDERLPGREEIVAQLKAAGVALDAGQRQHIHDLREAVSLARSLKAEYQLASKKDIALYFKSKAGCEGLWSDYKDTLLSQIGAESLEVKEDTHGEMPATLTPMGTLYIDLASSIDVDAERKRLGKELEKLAAHIQSAEQKLRNESFVSKAPEQVIANFKAQLESNRAKHAELEQVLGSLAK